MEIALLIISIICAVALFMWKYNHDMKKVAREMLIEQKKKFDKELERAEERAKIYLEWYKQALRK